jgi:molybdopterin converting factor small subunit
MTDAREMVLSVRLFAVLRELVGADSVELRMAPGGTVADALSSLSQLEGLREPLAHMGTVVAVNRQYADPSTVLTDDDELALIPPLSGGS